MAGLNRLSGRTPAQIRKIQLRVEALEDRRLLTTAVIQTIGFIDGVISDVTVPDGKSLIVPIAASDSGGKPLTYSVWSSNPQVTAQLHTGNTFLELTLQNYGEMVFELFNDDTPQEVSAITALVNKGFYNGQTINRIIPNVASQGGNPVPGLALHDEYIREQLFSGDGQLALANSGHNTNGSQFFVTNGPQRGFDFKNPIIGQLVRGFDVNRAANASPNSGSPDYTPTTPIVITSARIITDTSDAVLTITAKQGAGPATITVNAGDGQGISDTKTFQVQVAADSFDDPPILGPIADSFTPMGHPFIFYPEGFDAESDFMGSDPLVTTTRLDAASQANASIKTVANIVTVTPRVGFIGVLHLIFTVGEDTGTTPKNVEAYPVTLTVTVPAATQPADYDGDFQTDLAVVRPSNDLWIIRYASGGSLVTQFGDPSAHDIPAPGDYDGDGKTDMAVFRPSSDLWIMRLSTGGVRYVQFGDPAYGDIPVPGDYEGIGKTDLAVFRPSSDVWIVQLSTGALRIYQMGDPSHGDIPAPGDYDGDGVMDVGVYRPSTAEWIYRDRYGNDFTRYIGDPVHHDIPVPGDYNGDGQTDLAVFRPSTAQWIADLRGTVRFDQLGDPAYGDAPAWMPLANPSQFQGFAAPVRLFDSGAEREILYAMEPETSNDAPAFLSGTSRKWRGWPLFTN